MRFMAHGTTSLSLQLHTLDCKSILAFSSFWRYVHRCRLPCTKGHKRAKQDTIRPYRIFRFSIIKIRAGQCGQTTTTNTTTTATATATCTAAAVVVDVVTPTASTTTTDRATRPRVVSRRSDIVLLLCGDAAAIVRVEYFALVAPSRLRQLRL